MKGNKANIPEDLTLDHQRAIADILQPILHELEKDGAKQIVVILNETNEKGAAPVFVGYLLGKEMDEIRKRRCEPDPGIARFGGRPTSFMYEECLSIRGEILELDWTNPKDLERMKPTEQAQSLKRGIKYQMLRAINVDGRWAGIVGIGFQDKDKPKDGVKDEFKMVLTELATHSELVKYLEQHFEPGGPPATSNTDMQLEETIHQVSAGISRAINQGMNKLAEVLRPLSSKR